MGSDQETRKLNSPDAHSRRCELFGLDHMLTLINHQKSIKYHLFILYVPSIQLLIVYS